MKLLKIILLMLLVTPGVASASQWAKTYGGRGAEQNPVFVQKPDGGLVAASSGPISTGNNYNGWVISLSPGGDILWQKRYANDITSIGGIQQTDDGGYVFTGTGGATSVMTGSIPFLVKVDNKGDIQWQKMYEPFVGSVVNSVVQTSDGGYALGGANLIPFQPTAPASGFLIKTDGVGNIQWQNEYTSIIYSTQATPDGGFIAAGEDGHAVVLKLDSSGNIQWQKGYTIASLRDIAGAVKQTTDSGYIVAGVTWDKDNEGWDFVMKLDSLGNIQWQSFFGGVLGFALLNVIEIADGYLIPGFITLAASTDGSSDDDALLVKLDKNGNLLWQNLYGGSSFDRYHNVFLANDGGLIAVGSTASFGAGEKDLFVVKLDSNGGFPGCPLVRPATLSHGTLAFQTVTANTTTAPGVFVTKDPGLVAFDTSYPPGNICIEGIMSLPVGQHMYSYPTDLTPSLNADPAAAKPLALGHISESYLAPLSLRIGVLPFTGPVDAYLGIYAPSISPEIWLFTQDNMLQPLSEGLVKWKGGATEKISESIVEFMDTSEFPSGDYHFYLGVTPADGLNDFYLWETSFTKP